MNNSEWVTFWFEWKWWCSCSLSEEKCMWLLGDFFERLFKRKRLTRCISYCIIIIIIKWPLNKVSSRIIRENSVFMVVKMVSSHCDKSVWQIVLYLLFPSHARTLFFFIEFFSIGFVEWRWFFWLSGEFLFDILWIRVKLSKKFANAMKMCRICIQLSF